MRVVLVSAVLALFAAGGPALSSPLNGRSFEAVRIGGAAVAGDKTPTLAIEGSRASGTGGCNQYGASVKDLGRVVVEKRRKRPAQRIAKGSLLIGGVSSTRMFCGPGSAQESRFLDLLGKTRSYRMGRSELRLFSGGRRPRLLIVMRAAD